MVETISRTAIAAFLAAVVLSQAPSAETPAHIHKDDQHWAEGSALPHDGWIAFLDPAGTLKATRIKGDAQPKTVGAGIEMIRPKFGSGGRWIVGAAQGSSGQTIHMVRTSGNDPSQWTIHDLGLATSDGTCPYWNSPYEDPDNGIYEIAGTLTRQNSGTQHHVYAQKVNLSGSTPQLVGDRRIIARFDNPNKKFADDFHVAGDLILLDRGWAVLVTIPDKGRGVAGESTIYYYGKFNPYDRMCSVNLAPSATRWATNVGGQLRDDFRDGTPRQDAPTNHEGGVILQTKHISDPKIPMRDWVTKTSQGGISVCFVPKEICLPDSCYDQWYRQDNFWFGWAFLNDENYITGFHRPDEAQPNKGGYIIDIRTNTWHEVIPPTILAESMVAWFDGVSTPAWPGKPSPVSTTILEPGNTMRTAVGMQVPLKVDVSSWAGDITGVEFAVAGGVTIANDASAPYQTSWTPSQTGEFRIRIVARDDRGNTDTTFIPVTVLDNITLTSIQLTPSTARVPPKGSQQFAAVALDQDGEVLHTQPAFMWKVTGGGQVNGTGLFVAAAQPGAAPCTLTASAAGVSGIATVVVEYAELKVDFVKPLKIGSVPSGWLPDTGAFFGDQGNGYVYGWLDTLNNLHPAFKTNSSRHYDHCTIDVKPWVPTFVLMQNVAYGKVTQSGYWRIALPNGLYKVAMYGVDFDHYKQTGSLSITANDSLVMHGATGDCAIVSGTKMIPVTNGALTVTSPEGCTSPNHLSGIQIEAVKGEPAEGYVFYAPAANSTYSVGDTLRIMWAAAPSITEVVFAVSADQGKSWTEIFPSSILRGPDWGEAAWPIPANITVGGATVPLEGTELVLRVEEYNAEGGGQTATVPGISVASTTGPAPGVVSLPVPNVAPSVGMTGRGIVCRDMGLSTWRITVHDMSGRRVLDTVLPRTSSKATVIDRPLPAGSVIVTAVSGDGGRIVRRLMAVR